MMEMFTNKHPLKIDVSLKVKYADGSLAVVRSPAHAAVYPIETSLPLLPVNEDAK